MFYTFDQQFLNIASFTLVVFLVLSIFYKFMTVMINSKTRKNQMKYIEAVFLCFFLPYAGWRVINGDEYIETEHFEMKVINVYC